MDIGGQPKTLLMDCNLQLYLPYCGSLELQVIFKQFMDHETIICNLPGRNSTLDINPLTRDWRNADLDTTERKRISQVPNWLDHIYVF